MAAGRARSTCGGPTTSGKAGGEGPGKAASRQSDAQSADGKPAGPVTCQGKTVTGRNVKVTGLPEGITITADEFKACKTGDDVSELLDRKFAEERPAAPGGGS